MQGQNILYIQAFDEKRRLELSSILEKENWKNSTIDLDLILKKVKNIPQLEEMFAVPLGKEDHEKTFNGDNNNVEDLKSLMEKYPGAIILEGEPHLGKDLFRTT